MGRPKKLKPTVAENPIPVAETSTTIVETPGIELSNESDSPVTSSPQICTAPKIVSDTNDINFFGELDIDKNGKIISATPAWSMPQHKEKMDTEISMLEGSINRGVIPQKDMASAQTRLNTLKSKAEKVEIGKPVFNAKQKDIVYNSLKELSQELKTVMPSRTECMKGLVSAQSEYDKKTKPCVELKDSNLLNLARKCNVKIQGNRVTRDGANMVYRLLAKSIDANPNVEYLRRD